MSDELGRLAAVHGVATSYRDQQRRLVEVDAAAVVRTLELLGVAAASPAQVRAALARHDEERRRRVLPPTVVVRRGSAAVLPGRPGTPATAELEDGGERPLELGAVAPQDLPLGWHTLRAPGGDTATLVVAPERLHPERLPRGWGWMLQLYAARSSASWGMGDFADLARIAGWTAQRGGAFVLCNPLHAPAPTAPVQASPYYPTSRLFRSPLYLRVEQTPEYAAADPELRRRVDELGAPARAEDRTDRIDRERVWAAKRAALDLLWSQAPKRAEVLARFRAERGAALGRFALWCALAERHGPDWRRWPPALRRPDTAAAAPEAVRVQDRVAYFEWLQLLCDEQLQQAAAAASAMSVGVVHDLAVGADPGGADAWALQDVLAPASVGAPPDSFNQLGQDWGLPPWQPRALAAAGYAPYRDLLRAVLRHAGGIRIDHVLGLFRLWWVAPGEPAAAGTYVAYDSDALLAVLSLEAARAGAVVIGEDLGTVEPQVQRELAGRGILGSSVLWFERDVDPDTGQDHGRRPLRDWRELALASVSTHDLPTARGFCQGEHVRVRDELGQLGRPVEQERAQWQRERAELLDQLRSEGLLAADAADDDAVVAAMHSALTRTPSRLVAVQLADAIGDPRQPNLPGTSTEYPNWRLPLAAGEPGGGARPVLLEQVLADPQVDALAGRLRAGLEAGPPA